MATFSVKLITYFVLLTVLSVQGKQVNKVNVKNVLVSSYLMKLYNIWTSQNNQTNNQKIPSFNATAVRAMYFTTIQKISNNLTKLTIATSGGKKKINVKRDELHLYIIKHSNSSQTFTIKITDSQTNSLMVSHTITLQNTAWYTIPMSGTIQNWFNNVQQKMSLNVEFKNVNGNQRFPSIGTSLLEQPYLIVYID